MVGRDEAKRYTDQIRRISSIVQSMLGFQEYKAERGIIKSIMQNYEENPFTWVNDLIRDATWAQCEDVDVPRTASAVSAVLNDLDAEARENSAVIAFAPLNCY